MQAGVSVLNGPALNDLLRVQKSARGESLPLTKAIIGPTKPQQRTRATTELMISHATTQKRPPGEERPDNIRVVGKSISADFGAEDNAGQV